MKSIFDTLNIIYDEREKRGFTKLNAISLMFRVPASGSSRDARRRRGRSGRSELSLLPNAADLLIRIVRWPPCLSGLHLHWRVSNRFGPSREAPRWRWITWGSAAATMA